MDTSGQITYLTAHELSQRIKYKPNVINNQLKDSVLIEGKHYVRAFGRRKILYVWEAVQAELMAGASQAAERSAMPA